MGTSVSVQMIISWLFSNAVDKRNIEDSEVERTEKEVILSCFKTLS
jgi:hypothetical protein